MAFGLTAAGFIRKRIGDSIASVSDALRSALGDIRTDADSVIGQIIGAFAKPDADLWEQAENSYNSQYPATAEGVQLDGAVQYNGLQRIAASRSTVQAIIGSTVEGATVSANFEASVSGTGQFFTIDEGITISSASAIRNVLTVNAQDSTLYTITINATPYNYTSGIGESAATIAAALVAALAAQTTVVASNVDEAITIQAADTTVPYALSVTMDINIDEVYSLADFTAVNTGPVVALTGQLDTIETPEANIDSVENLVDATLGAERETDAALRLRRERSIRSTASASLEAIKAGIPKLVDGVTQVVGFENDTLTTDSGGRPGKSFELVVAGGDDTEIAETIFNKKSAGIQAYGTTTVNITDTDGNTFAVGFSRPGIDYVWVRVTLTKYTEETYPVDGDLQVAANILELGNEYIIGEDVIVQRFNSAIFAVPGIRSAVIEVAVTATAGGPPVYGTADIAVDGTDLAVFDSTRISVS